MSAPAAASHEDRARHYQRRKRQVALVDFLLGVAVLLGLLFSGWSHAWRDWALGLHSHPAVAVVFYFLALTAITQGLSFPLDFYGGHRLEHRFGLSRQTRIGWLKDWVKARGLSFGVGLAAVELVYFALRRFPETWWLLAATVFVVFLVALAQLAPVLLFPLFFKFEPLRDEELHQRLLRLSERLGARVRGIWVWKLSEKSSKANAALVGWGNTRRIVLADTLLEKHGAEEVETILAHELAHHIHNDIWKGLALRSALTFAGFYAVHRALVAWTAPLGFEGLADFANLPLLLLVAAGVSLVALPATNAFSRRLERRADALGLRTTGNRDAFIHSMEKLAEQNLSERNPHPWLEFIFHSHPSVEKRIAFARSWRSSEEAH